MRLSVIVPTLNEGASLARTLEAAREGKPFELLVVDGGSTDETIGIASRLADGIVWSLQGRSAQMNAGAAASNGDTLLFLHADTILPEGYRIWIERALVDPAVAGGRFDVALEGVEPKASNKVEPKASNKKDRFRNWMLRVVAWLMNVRSRLTRISTGDQAIFVRRSSFKAVGGFPPLPLMEDIAFSVRLKRVGRIACLRRRVRTSARRWERDGVLRTILLMWTLRLLYALGADPARLKRWYRDVR